MRPDDFFVDDGPGGMFGVSTRSLNVALLEHLRRGPLKEWEDVEVAVPLTRLIHDDLERYGTDGGQVMTEQQMRAALLALRAVVDRLGIAGFEVSFRDFSTFRNWWIRNGARGSGGWQARRDLLAGGLRQAPRSACRLGAASADVVAR
jgi:hypothetical protein